MKKFITIRSIRRGRFFCFLADSFRLRILFLVRSSYSIQKNRLLAASSSASNSTRGPFRRNLNLGGFRLEKSLEKSLALGNAANEREFRKRSYRALVMSQAAVLCVLA